MKPATGIILHRTDGDNDPLVLHLQKQTDTGGIVNAPDGATVVMSVRQDSGDTDITGAAEGGGSGRFAFPVATLDAGKRTDKFDVHVIDGGVKQHYVGDSKIKTRENIGA